ncbi:hypothetical protein [Virgibacillus necropolis]|uniref:Uncharacterized protein n=1 Tax=Virgibacillus necropolis TaxID=163877 RepID=A0A221MEI2_9BACI|nr:hypothetical protein [Virgibacillus necropolis]ASN06088.1 hypothetical protein CFK40_14205 [Virgibacillus necropolis]
MGEYHSITVTERLLSSESFSDKKDTLQVYQEKLADLDKDFFNLINTVIVDKGESGEIVDAMLQKTHLLTIKNKNLIEQLEQQINMSVKAFEQQVEDIKEQSLTITYKDTLSP